MTSYSSLQKADQGTLSVSANLQLGFDVAELLEEVAQVYLLARSVGTPLELPWDSVETRRMFYKFSKYKA